MHSTTFTHVARKRSARDGGLKLVRKPLLNCICDNFIVPVVTIVFALVVVVNFINSIGNM